MVAAEKRISQTDNLTFQRLGKPSVNLTGAEEQLDDGGSIPKPPTKESSKGNTRLATCHDCVLRSELGPSD